MNRGICPDCGWENTPGTDWCESCAQDLTYLNCPQGHSTFEQRLLDEPVTAAALRPPLIVQPHTSILDVLRMMDERRADAVLILEDTDLVGIFTERDYLYRVALQPLDLRSTPVKAVMTASPVTLNTSHSLAFALREMALGRYRHLPILDERNRCLGLLSAEGILSCLIDLFTDSQRSPADPRASRGT